ncbi:MAG: glutathione S-transferase N-terminal domain-containing protein [Terricaulis sp.]
MSPPIVHSFPGSAYRESTLTALKEKGVAYWTVLPPWVRRKAGPLARNPFEQAPAFAHGGLTLYETHAVIVLWSFMCGEASLQTSFSNALSQRALAPSRRH